MLENDFEKELEEKLIKYFKNEFGYEIHHLMFENRSESNCMVDDENGHNRRVPWLGITAYESAYIDMTTMPKRLIKKDIETRIVDYIGHLVKKNSKISEYYDEKMWLSVGSWNRECYMDFAYNEKQTVIACIKKVTNALPKDIYASSNPGLNIIYYADDYKKNNIELLRDCICKEINQAANEFVENKYKCAVDGLLEINILNPEMEGFNWCGLARQD